MLQLPAYEKVIQWPSGTQIELRLPKESMLMLPGGTEGALEYVAQRMRELGAPVWYHPMELKEFTHFGGVVGQNVTHPPQFAGLYGEVNILFEGFDLLVRWVNK